jgi:hypothetical protein
MNEATPTPAWPRPYWQPGDESILLQFYVFGQFASELTIPSLPYDSAGLPGGVELQRFDNAALRQWDGYPLSGALGKILREESAEVVELAGSAPHVLMVRGSFADCDNLDYLRDTLGVLAGLLDVGAVAILDPQILRVFGASEWRRQYLVKDGAPPRNHALILCNPEQAAGRFWVHTRGMRKFGRPDLSIHDVPESVLNHAGALCERLVEVQALGARFIAGQPLEVEGLSGDLIAQPGGSLEDPRFNNTHVAFHWPA